MRGHEGHMECILKMLAEQSIEHQQDLYVVFVDYSKAFDKVRHNALLKMLDKINIDDKDLRLLWNLYREQTACVQLPGGMTKEFRVKRDVRQRCVG